MTISPPLSPRSPTLSEGWTKEDGSPPTSPRPDAPILSKSDGHKPIRPGDSEPTPPSRSDKHVRFAVEEVEVEDKEEQKTCCRFWSQRFAGLLGSKQD